MSATHEVVVVPTGTANLASVLVGLERAGARPRVATAPDELRRAAYVVLPGVGAFAAAMDELQAAGATDVLRERIAADLPTLCVCLGLQLLAEGSEESPGARGLGVLPVRATRFPATERVPQLGWNEIRPSAGCELLERGYVYFANSFRLTEEPPGWNAAWTEYGGRFVAAVERGRVLACQFHPELSGGFGLALLRRWLERGAETAERRAC